MRYKYQAIDHQGQEVSGVLEAAAEREAARQLQKRGLTTLSLIADGGSVSTRRVVKGKPGQRDILTVFYELSTLLESDVSLIDAVESLTESSHHPFLGQMFADIGGQLRQGTAFSVALRKAELKLPWYVYQLAEAGELTGNLHGALRNSVEQMEYETKIRNELRSAMIYPVILIISGVGAVLLIFTIVVPRFANILKNRHAEDIPFLAQAVLHTGVFLNEHLLWIISVILLIIIGVGYSLGQPRIRKRVQDAMTRLPLIGEWIIEAETARWAAMMSTLLDNRVALMQALELAAQGIQLPSLQARLIQVSRAVRSGTSLSQALQDNDALSATGHNLIRAGEKAGALPKMLRSLANLLEDSGRVRMKRFLLLIEPAAILIIGGVIGVIITGVILAITSVNQITL